MRVRIRRLGLALVSALVLLAGQIGLVVQPAAAQSLIPNGWQEVGSPSGCVTTCSGPAPRYDESMAYDAASGQIVMYGGAGAYDGYNMLSDTWTWDGTQWNSEDVASPSARYGAAMAYDAKTNQVVMFGGSAEDNSLFNETWVWNGSSWQQMSPSASPPARWNATMAYDPATQQLVLFSGWNGGSSLEDTWTWDGSNWTQQAPLHTPNVEYGAALAYAPVPGSSNGDLVLFGADASNPTIAVTWLWNGQDWTAAQPAVSPPLTGGGQQAMAYDPAAGMTVLYDGLNGMWAWNGASWAQVASSVGGPGNRGASTMVYDDAQQGMVLFGGGETPIYNDTWTWQGAWLSLTAQSPNLPAAVTGTLYQAQLEAMGGTTPYHWALAAGATLPSWLQLQSDGTLTGTPPISAAGSDVSFGVQIVDSSPQSESTTENVTLQVQPPAIATLSFAPTPIGTAGGLTPGQTVPGAVYALTSSGQPAVGSQVYMSFQQTTGGGSVTVGSTEAGAPVGRPPAYPTQHSSDATAKLQ